MSEIELKLIIEDQNGNTLGVSDCESHHQLEEKIEKTHQDNYVISTKSITVVTMIVKVDGTPLAAIPAAADIGPESVMEDDPIYEEIEELLEEYPEEEFTEEEEEEV